MSLEAPLCPRAFTIRRWRSSRGRLVYNREVETSPRSTRSRFARRLVSLALGALALGLLMVASEVRTTWTESQASPEVGVDIPGWIAWLSLYAASGFAATLAFRPPTRLRYRPLRALLGAAVPLLLIAQSLVYYAGWALPLAIRGPYSWAVPDVLAVLVGVSLACGFDVDERPGRAASAIR